MSEPEIPSPTAAPGSPVEPAVGSSTGLNPSVAAGIACIFTIVSGIVFLVIEQRDKYVRFWAMQALLLGLAGFGAAVFFEIAGGILGYLPFIGGVMKFIVSMLHLAFGLAWLAAYVICIIQAFSRKEWEIPWLGKVARKLLIRFSREEHPAT